MMKARLLPMYLAPLLALPGCDHPGDPSACDACDEVTAAATTVPLAAILGFEQLEGWTLSRGGLARQLPLTEGQASIAVVDTTSAELRSVPLPRPAPVGEAISLDV